MFISFVFVCLDIEVCVCGCGSGCAAVWSVGDGATRPSAAPAPSGLWAGRAEGCGAAGREEPTRLAQLGRLTQLRHAGEYQTSPQYFFSHLIYLWHTCT